MTSVIVWTVNLRILFEICVFKHFSYVTGEKIQFLFYFFKLTIKEETVTAAVAIIEAWSLT